MKPRQYVISKRAVADLEDIWFYTVEKWSIEQADRYHSLIFDEIAFICRNVDAGKSMNHIRKGYRAAKVKSHFIFYRVVNDVVEIIRILHERMDIDNRLVE